MRQLLLVSVLALSGLTSPPYVRAEIWCAEPIWVHEWGVQVFDGSQRRRSTAPTIPPFFHGRSPQSSSGPSQTPVRHLPADGGERALPVVHFYAPVGAGPIPLGLEVGFSEGEAIRWYPQVDLRRSASSANSAAARVAHGSLVRRRITAANHRRPFLAPSDPTRQLIWNHLVGLAVPTHTPIPSRLPWMLRARGFERALWVNTRQESERFVFYEAQTREIQALVLSATPSATPTGSASIPGGRPLLLTNQTNHDVFDVLFVHHEGERKHVFHAPAIAAHSSVGFILEQHHVTRASFAGATRERLMTTITDAQTPSAPEHYTWSLDSCVTGQNPAVPNERAEGHRIGRDS